MTPIFQSPVPPFSLPSWYPAILKQPVLISFSGELRPEPDGLLPEFSLMPEAGLFPPSPGEAV